MLKHLAILFILISLAACSREQQGTDTVYNKETPKDFTRDPAASQAPQAALPMIPGKAELPAANIPDANTQIGQGTAVPQPQVSAPSPTAPEATPTQQTE